jgi:hypothetical protein
MFMVAGTHAPAGITLPGVAPAALVAPIAAALTAAALCAAALCAAAADSFAAPTAAAAFDGLRS